MWLGNLADLELHTSLARAADVTQPTMVVFDLDPGPPAGILECARVALRLRDMFDALGLRTVVKTSGSKGLQAYVPLNTATSYEQTKPFAQAVADLLAKQQPDEVVSTMSKPARARQGVRGLEPERPAQDHGERVLAARARPAHGLHAPALGGGRGSGRRATARRC